jgi:hypothetical protein
VPDQACSFFLALQHLAVLSPVVLCSLHTVLSNFLGPVVVAAAATTHHSAWKEVWTFERQID